MTFSRLRTAALVATAMIIAVAAVVLLNRTSEHGGTSTQRANEPTATASSKEGPAPPARGAYFGAWVKPTVYLQPARIAAVDTLQRQIGRRLDIVHTYLFWDGAFPTPSDLFFIHQGSYLLLSWAGVDTREIVSGAFDSLIRQRARAIEAMGKPIFLEWRWEMDRPNLQSQVHSPTEFIAAWDHIRAIFAQQHVRNVAWVWCPTARGFENGTAPAYYPGNNEVDWVCADAYPGVGAYRSLADSTTAFRAWAAQHHKPIMIGEYGVPQSYDPQQRAMWLRNAAQTAQSDPQIKALVYFDADPPGHGPQLSYGLQDGSAALGMFRRLAAQPYFDTRNLPTGGS